MATYYRDLAGLELQTNEATAARRVVLVEVGTAEAQTVTVSKGGSAFAASDSTATQVEGSLYSLAIDAADLDTLGPLCFKLAGATDTTYVHGLRVVSHDPYSDLADVLADTGTDGVAIADDAITANAIADDAITAASIATGAIAADGLATGALEAIAGAVLEEPVADHKSVAGSLAQVCNWIWRRLGKGLVRYDATALTVKTYDGATDGDTLLGTQTRSEAGTETDWTPG